VINSDDEATAIAEEVAKDAITKLVLGASSSGIFTTTNITVCLQKSQYALQDIVQFMLFSKENCPYDRQICILMEALLDDTSETSFSSSSSSNCTSAGQTDFGSVASCAVLHPSSLTTQWLKAHSSIEHTLLRPVLV